VRLKREGDGVYTACDGRFEVQNPHGMDPNDKDRHWYVVESANQETIHGPFDTLREVREFLATK
jgi:hypothetical protein